MNSHHKDGAGFRSGSPRGVCFLFLLLLFAWPSRANEPYTAGQEDPEFEIIARRLYREAAALSEDKPGRGEELFQKLVDEYSGSVWSARAKRWLGPNRITSIRKICGSGPVSNRIDVAVMGDGFKDSYSDRHQFERLCTDLTRVFFRSEIFEEYESYFNFYMVILASREDRIDYRKHSYDTALDGKRAADGRHITVDRERVRHFLSACEWSDNLAYAIVMEGGLGTGGGGVATVGKGMGRVVVHEWGHAFAGLADEYSREQSPKGVPRKGPNLSYSSDPRKAPWAHWHKKFPHKFKAHEGGAGVYKGVWRPTPDGCIMRAAHEFCAVCREAVVLKMYTIVRPIDEMTPNNAPIVAVAGGGEVFLDVYPLIPKSHSLEVEWSILPEGDQDFGRYYEPRYRGDIPGERVKGKKKTENNRKRHFLEIQNLLMRKKIGVGLYRIFAQVSDPVKVKGDEWVLKDDNGVCRQTVSWIVRVKPPPPPQPQAADIEINLAPYLDHGSLRRFDCVYTVHNRPGGAVCFVPFKKTIECGLIPMGFDEVCARDAGDRPLDAEDCAGGGWRVDSRKVNRFDFSWKRNVETDGAGMEHTYIMNSGDLLLCPEEVRAGKIDIAWTLPPDWAAALPWISQGRSWRIPSLDSMERNIICLGAFSVHESLTRHILLRTAVASRLEEEGIKLNSLFNQMLGEVGGAIPLRARSAFLVAADRGEAHWRVVRGNDSILFLFPGEYNPAAPEPKWESEFLELTAREFLTFFGPRSSDREGSFFLESAYRFLAPRVVAGTRNRDNDWLLSRTAEYLARAGEGTGGASALEEARSFSLAFFLDRIVIRLSGREGGLASFLSELQAGSPVGADLSLDKIMDRFSEYAGFDVKPFWKRLVSGSIGHIVESELDKCGLKIVREKKGPALVETASK